MTDLALTTVTTGYNISNINANFAKVQDTLNTDTLRLSAGNNTMLQELDMNGYAILNYPVTTNPSGLATVGIVNSEAATRAAADVALTQQIVNLQAALNSGLVGYQTKAIMDADHSKPAGTVALVTNDPTPANNTTYRYDGSVWVVSVDRVTLESASRQAGDNAIITGLALSTGSTGVGFLQVGTGATSRTVLDKLRETISVKDYGAKGDGTTDDSAAIQTALNAAGVLECGLYFPSGTYIVNTGLNLPAANISIFGNKGSSVISGNAGTFFTYPVATLVGGNVKIQNIDSLKFIVSNDNKAINCTQTWDGAGKAGPAITNCQFVHTSTTSTTVTSIVLSGVWSGLIQNNFFIGRGAGGGPTNNIGGYGIHAVFTADMNSSVMNLLISNNTFVSIANPIRLDGRVISTGGRTEGIRIYGNNMAAGNVGIYSQSSNNTAVVGNQIDDFSVAVQSEGDFDYVCTGNHLNGIVSGIYVVAISSGFAERITITGNKVGTSSTGVGIRFNNSVGDQFIRALTITGNSIAAVSLSTGQGVAFQGTNIIANVTIQANDFQALQYGLWFSGTSHVVKASGNVYNNVTTPVFNGSVLVGNPAGSYSNALLLSLTGGAGTETINVPLPAGFFANKPDGVLCTSLNDYTLGFYDWDNSTTTNARIILRTVDGGNLSAGAHRFSFVATGLVN